MFKGELHHKSLNYNAMCYPLQRKCHSSVVSQTEFSIQEHVLCVYAAGEQSCGNSQIFP